MTRDTRGEPDDIAARLHSVAIHLLRRVRQTDAQTGLSAAQASALSVLVFGGPCTIGELAAAEQVTAPTMTRMVSGLETAGWVVRKPGEADRRAVIVSATAQGRRALERGRRLRVAQIEALLADLSKAERTRVASAVASLERVLGR